MIDITLVSHASVIIDTGTVRLWTDPWLAGKAFNDSWALITPAVLADEWYPRLDYLWISHEHADHFHVPTLRALPDEVKQRVTVLTRTGDAPKLTQALTRMGFAHVLPIAHRGRIALPGGAEAYSYEVGQMDTCLAVIDGGDVVLNANDAELSDTDCRLLRQDLGPCRTVLNQFSVAGYGGHPDHQTHLTAQAERVLGSLVHDHEALGADVTIPFASYVYFCCEDNRYVNSYANRPRDVDQALSARGLRAVVLAPGDTYTVGEAHDSAAALDWWDGCFDGVDELPYDAVEPVPLAEIEEAFRQRCDQLRTVLPGAALMWMGAITAMIPDLGVTVRFCLAARTFQVVGSGTEPDVTVNSQPLDFAFRHPYGVQTLGVSARVTVRPGDRQWRRHRVAFAVANSGLDLRWHRLISRGNLRFVRPRVRGGLAQMRHLLRRSSAETAEAAPGTGSGTGAPP